MGIDEAVSRTPGFNDPRPSVPNHPDLFFDQPDKDYLDFIARDVVRLRGTDLEYYILEDSTQRMDGDRPTSDKDGLPTFAIRKHSGNVPLYAEPIILRNQIDALVTEAEPDWNFSGPFLTRGVVSEPQTEEDPDERGSIYTRTVTVDVSRVIMDELGIVCHRGDLIKLPLLLNDLFDIVDVSRDDSRFGATGFFTTYKLSLTRSSKFLPQRKNLPSENNRFRL